MLSSKAYTETFYIINLMSEEMKNKVYVRNCNINKRIFFDFSNIFKYLVNLS